MTGPRPTPPPKTRHHFAAAAALNPAAVRHELKHVTGFNAKLALLITRGVGSMACAYLFAAIALISLPAALSSGQVIIIVAWIAQTFLQLVLLSIIMVGQQVQSAAADSRAEHTFQDTEQILNELDIRTEGGLKAVLDAIASLAAETRASTVRDQPHAPPQR